MSETCNTCNREMDNPNDLTTKNCGGDCLRWMAEVGGDPYCIEEMKLIEEVAG